LSEDDRMVRATLDSFSVHIALVDASGEIVLTNGAWRRFARANGSPPIRDRGPHLGIFRAPVPYREERLKSLVGRFPGRQSHRWLVVYCRG
jgi:hypothetical protein